jgi:hypothetical protein
VEIYLHSHNTPSWCGAQLKHRDNFAFNFIQHTNSLNIAPLFIKMGALSSSLTNMEVEQLVKYVHEILEVHLPSCLTE